MGGPSSCCATARASSGSSSIEEGTAELWVGRGEAAGLRIDWDEEVSALHAQIEVVAGECTLLDDGLSRNGSFVGDGARARPPAPARRRHAALRPHHRALPPPRRVRAGSDRRRRRDPGRGDDLARPAPRPARPLPPLQGRLGLRHAADQPGDRRRSSTSASTRSRPTCGPSSRSSSSRTCRRTASASPWLSGRCRAASSPRATFDAAPTFSSQARPGRICDWSACALCPHSIVSPVDHSFFDRKAMT